MRQHLELLLNDLENAWETLAWEDTQPVEKHVTNAIARVRRLLLCCRDGVAYPPAPAAGSDSLRNTYSD